MVGFGDIGDEPTRKECGEGEFGEDNEFGAPAVCGTEQFDQTLDY